MNSYKVIISPYVKKNGHSKIYLQVLIGRSVKKLFHLDLDWPPAFFDTDRGMCLARKKNDRDAEDYNILLEEARHKASQIFKTYRLNDRKLTMYLFEREWSCDIDRVDFIDYMEKKMKLRLKDKEISHLTFKNQNRALNMLKKYRVVIPFADFDHKWARKYDAFLKDTIVSKNTNGINSRWHHHKTIRTYIKLAIKEDHIKTESPYDYFSPPTTQSTWKPIYEEDLRKLIDYYNGAEISAYQKRCLRRFLFACATSMRISDLVQVRENWLHSDGMLRYVAYKNRKKNKMIEFPMVGLARQMFDDAVAEMPKGAKLFYTSQEQTSNRLLKKIALKLGITRNLHHHVARSTFVTLYLKNGGKLDMAQYYAGHTYISSTMIYNHIDQERVRKEIIDFGEL